MNIAVIDDLEIDRAQLLNDIRLYAKENALLVRLTEYESGEAFLTQDAVLGLDAVFLDIYMGTLTGMDVAREIHSLNPACQIVFVTTSPAFAVESYEVQAIYYILKPCEYKNIANVMKLLEQKLQKSSRFIKVKEGREWCKIMLTDILYIDYSNHYIQIHTENAIISTYMKFSVMEDMLCGYHEFLNCYRCIIINMEKIKKVDNLFFLLCNGEYVPINRKRVKEIKDRYISFVFGDMDVGDNCHD